jgi:hypothetical protein
VASTASGVTSRPVTPVPPVVRITTSMSFIGDPGIFTSALDQRDLVGARSSAVGQDVAGAQSMPLDQRVARPVRVSSVPRVGNRASTAMFTGLNGLVSSMRFMRPLYSTVRHPSMFATAEPRNTTEGFFPAAPEGHQDFPLTLQGRNLVIAARKFAKLGDIMTGPTDWKHDGVRVIPAGSLDTNTAQTPGMNRAAAINFARVGAQKLWAGTVTIHAHAKTGAIITDTWRA